MGCPLSKELYSDEMSIWKFFSGVPVGLNISFLFFFFFLGPSLSLSLLLRARVSGFWFGVSNYDPFRNELMKEETREQFAEKTLTVDIAVCRHNTKL